MLLSAIFRYAAFDAMPPLPGCFRHTMGRHYCQAVASLIAPSCHDFILPLTSPGFSRRYGLLCLYAAAFASTVSLILRQVSRFSFRPATLSLIAHYFDISDAAITLSPVDATAKCVSLNATASFQS